MGGQFGSFTLSDRDVGRQTTAPLARGAVALAALMTIASPAGAATPFDAQPLDAGALLDRIERLSTVGSVLYVAAHPDDENTRLIAWLVGQRGLRTAYLSMTRGGGGQNLIGTEQAEMLGVVRTGELLAARGVDGAEQRFTRTRDFGYSKTPDETLRIWGRDAALADVVWAIRAFRPDVIITRFATTGRNHGHHTASALLAHEAFDAAADAKCFPEQLAHAGVWQTARLFENKSHWRIKPDTDTSQWLQVDVGTFDPLRGVGYGEIAAHSRTMHKSQGFGSSPQRGSVREYLTPEKVAAGAAPKPGDDPFVGLKLDWSRFEGTAALQKALAEAAAEFDPRAPHASLAKLAEAHRLMQTVPDAHWRAVKLAELEQVMAACAGLYLEATVEQPAARPGETVKVKLSALGRSPSAVLLTGAAVDAGDGSTPAPPLDATLVADGAQAIELGVAVPADLLTRPHWLVERPTSALYAIPEQTERDRPDTPAALSARFNVTIGGVPLQFRVPVQFTRTDAVLGERRHDLEILPPVTATFAAAGTVLPVGETGRVRVTVHTTVDRPLKGVLSLRAPEGYKVRPAHMSFELGPKAPERGFDVELTPGPKARAGLLRAQVETGGRMWSLQQQIVDYDHLPRRTVLSPAEMRLVPVDLKRGPTRIGYLPGPGDKVAEALRLVGYTVEEIDVDTVAEGDLSRFDALVTGIRAYNKHPRLVALHDRLMAYVAGGGRLVVQYNTNNRFNPLDGPIGPHPFSITRGRITDETAALTPVDPKHAVLTTPNALGADDYAGWVQERGLYFAGDIDPQYTPIFRGNDPGEDPLDGSLLVARHGKGVFVYSGLSFFRQLPAGVPGAFRLFANILAL